jgi:hypothetical protein
LPGKGRGKRETVTEDRDERLDRELIELLNELRVALPGVQVLFAFLLTIPFTRGFPRLDAVDRDVYFAALLATALSTALLIAPSAHHRLLFRQHSKEQLLATANRLAIVGLAALAAGVACSIFVVTDVIFGRASACGVAAGASVLFVLLWYVLGLALRERLRP